MLPSVFKEQKYQIKTMIKATFEEIRTGRLYQGQREVYCRSLWRYAQIPRSQRIRMDGSLLFSSNQYKTLIFQNSHITEQSIKSALNFMLRLQKKKKERKKCHSYTNSSSSTMNFLSFTFPASHSQTFPSGLGGNA